MDVFDRESVHFFIWKRAAVKHFIKEAGGKRGGMSLRNTEEREKKGKGREN